VLLRAIRVVLPFLVLAAPVAAQTAPDAGPKWLIDLSYARSTKAKANGVGLRIEPIRIGAANPIRIGLDATYFYWQRWETYSGGGVGSGYSDFGSMAFGLTAEKHFGGSALRPHLGAGVYNIWSTYTPETGNSVSEVGWLKMFSLRGGVTWLSNVRWRNGTRGLTMRAELEEQFASGGNDLLIKVGVGIARF
jgi:hypothetical protein